MAERFLGWKETATDQLICHCSKHRDHDCRKHKKDFTGCTNDLHSKELVCFTVGFKNFFQNVIARENDSKCFNQQK